MKIYTRRGDDGDTALLGGSRVHKDNVRVAAYGEVDELSAHVGLVRSTPPHTTRDGLFAAIQRDLFAIGSHLASVAEPPSGQRFAKTELSDDRIAQLERAIDEAAEKLPSLKAFVLPGGTPKAAQLHVARTVCRRAERAVVHLSHEATVPSVILVYLNRLSDLLFTMARLANHEAGEQDSTW